MQTEILCAKGTLTIGFEFDLWASSVTDPWDRGAITYRLDQKTGKKRGKKG